MKYFVLFSLLALMSICNKPTPDSVRLALPDTAGRDVVASVAGYRLALQNGQERCFLRYKPVAKVEGTDEGLDLDLEAPCEFIRIPPSDEVMVYDYNWKSKKLFVVAVVGGSPHPTSSDSYMPQGCGTEFQMLSLYPDRVLKGEKVGPSRIHVGCPSGGLDEIMFTEFAKRE